MNAVKVLVIRSCQFFRVRTIRVVQFAAALLAGKLFPRHLNIVSRDDILGMRQKGYSIDIP
jgi:hypothetical protein